MRKQRLQDIVNPADGPSVVALTGVAQAGRTRALAELYAAHRARGTRVIAVQCSPGGFLSAAPALTGPRSGGADLPPPRACAPGRLRQAHRDPEAAERAASDLARELTGESPALLLIDDAQWLHAGTLAVLTSLIPKIERTPAQLVCAVRTPAPGLAGLADAWRSLQARGAAVSVRLRPWNRDEIAGVLRDAFHAVPAAGLVDEVRRLTRGVPGAVDELVTWLAASEAVTVVDRHAYRRPVSGARAIEGRLIEPVASLGADTLAAAESVTVLKPLGAAMPAVLRDSTTGADTDAALSRLIAAGILHRAPGGRSWRFLPPLLEVALRARIAPFRRRELAAAAVTAVWAGATSLDPAAAEVTDWIADGGGLLDPARSRRQLDQQARAAMGTAPDRAARWWAAVAELATSRTERATASAMRVIASYTSGDHDQAVRQAGRVLLDFGDAVPRDRLNGMLQCFVVALHNLGDTATLESIATRPGDLIADQALAPLSQATAAAMLNRWATVRAALAAVRRDEPGTGERTGALHADLIQSIADLFQGDVRRLARRAASAPQWDERRYAAQWQNDETVSMLLAAGDFRAAERLLERTGTPAARLNAFNRANLAMLRGTDTSGIEAARSAIACAADQGFDVWHTTTVQTLAFLLIGQGRLSSARELLDTAYSVPLTLSHSRDAARSLIDLLLGEPARAQDRLRAAVSRTRASGVVLGTDMLLALIAAACQRRDPAAVRCVLDELDSLADRMPTSRTALCATLARALAADDPTAATAALKIAEDRAIPFERAVVILLAVRARLSDPALLPDAYEAFGRLDALLFRAWTRAAMNDAGISVPGRRQSLAESERLLAELVAEGLSNKQIARLLSVSEKGVEGRLARLFSRRGYRSRAQLAAAVASGTDFGPA